MIGSEQFAEVLANNLIPCSSYEPLPDGWRYLGGGAYRTAFRGPDGVVYKKQYVQHRNGSWYTGDGGNRSEAETFRFLRDEKGFIWIPDFHLFDNGIIAMQFLDDVTTIRDLDRPGNRERYDEITSVISDSGWRNLGLDDYGLLFLRDAGNGSYST